MKVQLPKEILDYLNQGEAVIAEIQGETPGARCFVSIRPRPNPDVPREEARYLNSRYSMWEFWHYALRRMVLRPGWEANEWDYDLFLLEDERAQTRTEAEFYSALAKWVGDPTVLKHHDDSDCPE